MVLSKAQDRIISLQFGFVIHFVFKLIPTYYNGSQMVFYNFCAAAS